MVGFVRRCSGKPHYDNSWLKGGQPGATSLHTFLLAQGSMALPNAVRQ